MHVFNPPSPLERNFYTNALEEFGDFANEDENDSFSSTSDRSFDSAREHFDWGPAKLVRMLSHSSIRTSQSLVDENEAELADYAMIPRNKGSDDANPFVDQLQDMAVEAIETIDDKNDDKSLNYDPAKSQQKVDETSNVSRKKKKKSKSEGKKKSRRKERQLSDIPEEPELEKRRKTSRKSTLRVAYLELPAIEENLEDNVSELFAELNAIPKYAAIFVEKKKKRNSKKKKPVKSRRQCNTSIVGIPENGEILQTNPSIFTTPDDELNEIVDAPPLIRTKTPLDLARFTKNKTHCEEGDLLSSDSSPNDVAAHPSLASQCHDEIEHFATMMKPLNRSIQAHLPAVLIPTKLRSNVSLEFDMLVSTRSSNRTDELAVDGDDDQSVESLDTLFPDQSSMSKAVVNGRQRRLDRVSYQRAAAAKSGASFKANWPTAPVAKPLPTAAASSNKLGWSLAPASKSSSAEDDDDRSVESMDTPFPDQSLIAKAVAKDKQRRQLRASQRAAAKAAAISKPLWPAAPVPAPRPISAPSSTRPLPVEQEDDDRSVESMDTPFPDQSLIAKAVAKDKQRRQLRASQRAATKAAAISKPLWPTAPVPAPRPISAPSTTLPAEEDDDRSVESMDTPFPDQSLIAKAVAKDKQRRQLRASQRAAAKAAAISKPLWPTAPEPASNPPLPAAGGVVSFATTCQSLIVQDNKNFQERVAQRATVQAAASNPPASSRTVYSKQDWSSFDKGYRTDQRVYTTQQRWSSFEKDYSKGESAHHIVASEHSLLFAKAVGKHSNQEQERAAIFLRAASKAVASRAIEPSKQNWTRDKIMNTFVAADQAAFRAKQFTEAQHTRQIHESRHVWPSRPAQNSRVYSTGPRAASMPSEKKSPAKVHGSYSCLRLPHEAVQQLQTSQRRYLEGEQREPSLATEMLTSFRRPVEQINGRNERNGNRNMERAHRK
jgi:surface antigen